MRSALPSLELLAESVDDRFTTGKIVYECRIPAVLKIPARRTAGTDDSGIDKSVGRSGALIKMAVVSGDVPGRSGMRDKIALVEVKICRRVVVMRECYNDADKTGRRPDRRV